MASLLSISFYADQINTTIHNFDNSSWHMFSILCRQVLLGRHEQSAWALGSMPDMSGERLGQTTYRGSSSGGTYVLEPVEMEQQQGSLGNKVGELGLKDSDEQEEGRVAEELREDVEMQDGEVAGEGFGGGRILRSWPRPISCRWSDEEGDERFMKQLRELSSVDEAEEAEQVSVGDASRAGRGTGSDMETESISADTTSSEEEEAPEGTDDYNSIPPSPASSGPMGYVTSNTEICSTIDIDIDSSESEDGGVDVPMSEEDADQSRPGDEDEDEVQEYDANLLRVGLLRLLVAEMGGMAALPPVIDSPSVDEEFGVDD